MKSYLVKLFMGVSSATGCLVSCLASAGAGAGLGAGDAAGSVFLGLASVPSKVLSISWSTFLSVVCLALFFTLFMMPLSCAKAANGRNAINKAKMNRLFMV